MEILYKSLYNYDEFKVLNNEYCLNLSSSLIKICCREDIKEVQIDDEVINNIIDKKEFIYNKIKTSNKKTIEIKVKVLNENKKEKTYKRIIKVKEDSFVHDINEIEMINSLGKKAFENIISGFNDSQNYYDVIMDNLKGELKDIENILKAVTIIVKLSKEINKVPKVDLIEKEVVRDSSEVKKISSQSARYFTMHPEYWYREGENLPKPIKILAETFEENRDIYENQLIVYILYKSKKILKKIILNLETQITTLYNSIIKDKVSINLDELLEDNKITKEINIMENEERLSINKIYLSNFKKLTQKIGILLLDFSDVKLNLNLKVKVTQKILYDKRYYRILKYYKKYLSNLDFSIKEIIESTISPIYNYLFLASEVICKSLYYLGFYEINTLTNIEYENVFRENQNIIIEGKHYFDKDNFKFSLNINSFNDDICKIVLKFIYKNKIETIRFNINTDFKDKNSNIGFEDIENLYKINIDKNYNTNILLNSIPIENMSFENEKIKLNAIFKLSTLGNNFLTSDDYEKYGGYKMGVIPFSNKYIVSVYDKLIKLFRVKFIQLGFTNYCTYCNNGKFEMQEDELLVCSSCSKRLAINKCSCGGEIVKFLSKENVEIIEEKEKDFIKYHDSYELKSTNLGSCYEKFYSNSGGFCSKCGKCQKLDKNCIKCKARE